MKIKPLVLVCFYLVAIVAANLSIVYFGPQMAIWNALVLIAFDLTARDGLHENWKGRNLWPKMLLLIASGSLLSWLLNRDAGQIALASFVAFALAGLADAVVYQLLGSRSRIVKMNGSNIAGALVDTVAFVALAGLPLWVIPGQIIAKIAGGALWSILFARMISFNPAASKVTISSD